LQPVQPAGELLCHFLKFSVHVFSSPRTIYGSCCSNLNIMALSTSFANEISIAPAADIREQSNLSEKPTRRGATAPLSVRLSPSSHPPVFRYDNGHHNCPSFPSSPQIHCTPFLPGKRSEETYFRVQFGGKYARQSVR
jgi:hypothetical protein